MRAVWTLIDFVASFSTGILRGVQLKKVSFTWLEHRMIASANAWVSLQVHPVLRAVCGGALDDASARTRWTSLRAVTLGVVHGTQGVQNRVYSCNASLCTQVRTALSGDDVSYFGRFYSKLSMQMHPCALLVPLPVRVSSSSRSGRRREALPGPGSAPSGLTGSARKRRRASSIVEKQHGKAHVSHEKCGSSGRTSGSGRRGDGVASAASAGIGTRQPNFEASDAWQEVHVA